MGRATMRASDPAHAQPEVGVTDFDGTQIGSMPNQTGGMSAGTGKLVEFGWIRLLYYKNFEKRGCQVRVQWLS